MSRLRRRANVSLGAACGAAVGAAGVAGAAGEAGASDRPASGRAPSRRWRSDIAYVMLRSDARIHNTELITNNSGVTYIGIRH
jgi:hypothetical protein